MKASDKEILFDFFQATESLLYKTSVSLSEKPVFTDDAELSTESSLSSSVSEENESNSFSENSTSDSSVQKNIGTEESESFSTSALTPSVSSIAEKIKKCTNCPLHSSRTNTVPGIGVEKPLVMVIGEGPGEMEDLKGEPFVGPAGVLLDKMLASIGLSRNTNCFITNIVKCRPPHNRDPESSESAACDAYLQAQIALLKPKAILILGSPAVKHILKTASGIMSIRGKFYDVKGIPAIATYHPSFLLRDPSKKMEAWTDLKTLRAFLMEQSQK